MFACKCLNVSLKISSSQSPSDLFLLAKSETSGQITSSTDAQQKHRINLDELARLQKNHEIYADCVGFFNQAIGPQTDLTENIVQTELVYKVPAGAWSLIYCINCNSITHATKINTSVATEYLINSSLSTNLEEFNSLKSSEAFSKTFGILIFPTKSHLINSIGEAFYRREEDSESGFSTNPKYGNAADSVRQQAQIKKVTQQFNDNVQREIYETDDRIRRFTEQQFALLKTCREKATEEYQILVRLIDQVPEKFKVIENTKNLTTTTQAETPGQPPKSLFALKHHQQNINLDTPPATPDSTPMSIGNSPTFKQQQTGNIFSNSNNQNANDDCLFEMEGMETYPAGNQHASMCDLEETEDAEDALTELDSGVNVPRSTRRQSFNVAKSLPISIANNADTKYEMIDIENELGDDSNIDIAASIKALAKSVHGDTIFGDLPRPRFSNQI